MRRSKSEIYLHFVWTTHDRQPWLTPELTPPVYRCICAIAKRLGCTVLAIGGMPDHVHLAVKLPPRTHISLVAQQVKGASSKLAGDLCRRELPFSWQEGYGVFSLSRPDVPQVVAYIQDQPRRHAKGRLWPDLEESDEEAK